jgi:hypothetical protein
MALDIDKESLISAQANIDRNGLSERITLLRADPTGPIMLPLIQSPAASYVIYRNNRMRNLPWI